MSECLLLAAVTHPDFELPALQLERKGTLCFLRFRRNVAGWGFELLTRVASQVHFRSGRADQDRLTLMEWTGITHR